MEDEKEDLAEAASFLSSHCGDTNPTVGVICGSGLSGLVNALDRKTAVVNYEEIPHFPQSTVEGHAGELVFGDVGGVGVVLMRGRFHSYEGYEMKIVTFPVKLMRHLGVEKLIVTNAAGGVNRSFNVGDVMIISEHIGFPLMAGKHPLVGPNDVTFKGPRFPPMSDAYDIVLRELVWETAGELGMQDFFRRSGCYFMVSGPTYETGAESRMILRMGGDSVGMSTVPEVIVARHCGMKVIGMSLITNSVRLPGDSGPAASHEEVLETVEMRSKQMQSLVKTVISKLSPGKLGPKEIQLRRSGEEYIRNATQQLSFTNIVEELKGLNLNEMTPLQAHQKLQELQKAVSNDK